MSPSVGLALAICAPFVAFLWTLSGNSYWLDGGEFVAAAVALDIAHPPGHPLTAVYGKFWSFFPLGSLAFRVALGQAVATAVASGLLYRTCRATAIALGAGTGVPATAAALAGAWLWALSFGVWFQAVRPEVYALQGLVLLVAVDGMVRSQLDRSRDPRPLYVATFAVGLGLTNHHLMSFLFFPALLWCLSTTVRRHGARPVAVCAGLGLLACSVYVYLPVRAATDPPANFGAPVTIERFLWVLSARVYAKNVGAHDPEPFDQRFGDLAVALFEDLHAIPLFFAAFGVYAVLRRESCRKAGVLLLLIATTVVAARGWLGSVRGNPDALGYALGGVAALAALSSAGLAALLGLATRQRSLRAPAALIAVASALAVLGLQLATTTARADLSRFRGTDAFDEFRLRALPTRSVLIAATPQGVFRHLELAAAEAVRPDVLMVPLPFLNYPGVADALKRAHPELQALVDTFMAADALQIEPLLNLAANRPVLTELEAHVPPATYRVLLPVGVLYAVVHPRAVPSALPQAEALQRRIEQRLSAMLGRDVAERETEHQLLWVHYMSALYYAAHGRTEFARASLHEAARLFPHDAHVHALQRAIDSGGGPLDVRPFLTAAAP